MKVIVVYVGNEYAPNIDHGIDNDLWGFPRAAGSSAGPKGDGIEADTSTVLLLATGYTGGSPRSHGKPPDPHYLEQFCGNEAGPFSIEAHAAVVDGDLFEDNTPFWPNEKLGDPSMYPWRIKLGGGAQLGALSLDESSFNREALEQIRLSILGPAPKLIEPDDVAASPAIAELGKFGSAEATLQTAKSSATISKRTRKLFGSDWERNRAVEQRAVEVATEALERDGWYVESVEKLNVGYDLKCERASDALHVEVKGSSTDRIAVLVSANEADFAASNPTTARLYVVTSIDVNRDDDAWNATGGDLVHTGPWKPFPDGLRAIGYEYEF